MQKERPKTPILTLVLVAANLAVAFWAPFSSLSSDFAFQSHQPTLLSALTSLFLHDPQNLFHLLGNMVFLAAVGPLVESSVGRPKFLLVYILGGLAGVGGHLLVTIVSGVSVPLIGASGAIAACVGYCSVRYMRRNVPMAPKFKLSVGVVALVWVSLQAIGAFIKFGDGGGTSFIAHLAGFLGGFLLAFVFRASKDAKVEQSHERIEEMGERSPAALLATADEHLRDHPGDIKALWKKADALHAMGDYSTESEVLLEMLDSSANKSDIVERLHGCGKLSALAPSERMKQSEKMNESLCRVLLESVVKEPDNEPERPHALLALAERSEDKKRSELIHELEQKYELHAATELAKARGLIQ